MTAFHNLVNKVAGQPPSYNKKADYKFGKTLGAGTFGIVKYAKQHSTGDEVAVKIIVKKNLKGNDHVVIEELSLLKECHHPHIIAFKDWFESKEKFYIVTQLATGGELFDRICDYGKFTEKDARQSVKDILEAVDYLHHKDIVHRDLKPENLLFVTPDPQASLVLTDFGIAKHLKSPDEVLHSMAGSFGYAAPEVLKGTGHGKPCDIWSLGVITFTILSGYSPFRSESVRDFLEEIEGPNALVFHKKYWQDVSEDAKDFIKSCLALDPALRPTSAELLKHEWITGDTTKSIDLLPNIREGFNARSKFRHAIEAVRLHNRIKSLNLVDSDDEDEDDEVATQTDKLSLLSVASSMRPRAHSRTKSGNGAAAFQEVVLAAKRNKELLANDNTSKQDEEAVEDH